MEKKEEIITNDPIRSLRNIISQYKSPRFEILPPFTGGFVGYFSYDFFKYNEKSVNLLNSNKDNFDDFYLMLFDTVVAFDHLKQKIFIVVNTPVENFENEFKKTEKKIKEVEELIKSTSVKKEQKSKLKSDFKMLYSKEKFKEMVENIKHHIFEGDIFQAVLSNRAEADFEGSLLKTYRILRTINPSPYMFYLNFEDIEIAGASPKTLVTLKEKELTNYALAGTCKLGENDVEDKCLYHSF
jgi:anthranilate synthase component 1